VPDRKIKQISVISGKGGTGKTSFVAAFAYLGKDLVLADCDVDAANLHLLVAGRPGDGKAEPFKSGFKARMDADVCAGCGRCLEVCRFHAVRLTEGAGPGRGNPVSIRELSCEGCGCCVDECPVSALSLVENTAGELYVSPSRFGTLVHARLAPGEGTSGKLVTRVRQRAVEIAYRQGAELVLIDGSPGIGCPVIASVSNADGALIVTEPTVSGFHDLTRVMDLCAHFKVPACAAINKWDINPDLTISIEEHCRKREVEILGSVPFDPVFVRALTAGVTVMEYGESDAAMNLNAIWTALQNFLRKYGNGDSNAAAN